MRVVLVLLSFVLLASCGCPYPRIRHYVVADKKRPVEQTEDKSQAEQKKKWPKHPLAWKR